MSRIFRTEDEKNIIYLSGYNIVWERRYNNRIPSDLMIISEEVPTDVYAASLNAVIDIINRSKNVSISFSSFNDKEGSTFEQYLFDHFKLNYAKTEERITLLVEKSKKITTGVREISKSLLIGLINQHFNYEMPDT